MAPPSSSRTVIVVGGGLVGVSTAWLLQRQGHSVALVDSGPEPSSGSRAALGLLMAKVFHRDRGRAWRLRSRSLELWHQWICELAESGQQIPWRAGLLLLAADTGERDRQLRLVSERGGDGGTLAWWEPRHLADLTPTLPAGALGGLYSPQDGQLDPRAALEALAIDGQRRGVSTYRKPAVSVRRLGGGDGGGDGWRVELPDGEWLEAGWLVLSAALASVDLLRPLGHELALEPVLGQALEMELSPQWSPPDRGARAAEVLWTWPGAVVWRGMNLVPRPDLAGGRRFWLGATLEPGERADDGALSRLLELQGAAPTWLRQSRVIRQWQGLRARPVGRPAPLLERLEPGLLLVTAHYRNGVLLAPASAEWVLQQVESG